MAPGASPEMPPWPREKLSLPTTCYYLCLVEHREVINFLQVCVRPRFSLDTSSIDHYFLFSVDILPRELSIWPEYDS